MREPVSHMTNTPIDYTSLTDDELERLIKSEYPSSDTGFGAITERHRRILKKTHWSVTPGFVVGVVAMVASCIDLVVHTSVIEGSISEKSSGPHAKVSADHFRTNDVQRRASLPMDEHSRQARLESRYRIENLHTTSNSDDAEWQGSTKNHEGSLGGSRRITEILHVTGRIENNRVESETVFSFDGTSYRRGLISPETIFESAAPFVKGGDE